MQIYLPITGYSLDHPQAVDLRVPQQDIWHSVSEREKHTGLRQGRTLSVGDLISIPIIDINDLVVWQKIRNIETLACLDEVAMFGVYYCSCQ